MADDLRPAVRSRVQSKKMTPADELVGQRIKFRRRIADMSLEELASKLQIAPQQLQKYESGHNRVTAGRLLALSKILDVPVQWFFEQQPESDRIPETASPRSAISTDFVVPPDELAEVIRLFASLRDARVRSHCLGMLRLLQHTKLD
jgi:transcriptional regulator with XRE-family HTH domain